MALPAAALQFVARPPGRGLGHSRRRQGPSEVRENIASLQAPIPAAFWSDLKAQKLIDPDSPVPAGQLTHGRGRTMRRRR